MKKAFLVTHKVTTRVIVDVPEDFDINNCNLIHEKDAKAYNAITETANWEVRNRLNTDDITSIEEDLDSPFDASKDVISIIPY